MSSTNRVLLRYISDIHLEFIKPNKLDRLLHKIKPSVDEEILILAGDIGNSYNENYKTFLDHINTHFTKTFMIAGNHEYYGSNRMENVKSQIKNVCESYPNITFLDNSYEDYAGIRFIGTTLWSNITNPFYEINDTVYIPNMTVKKYNGLHQECLEYLKTALDPDRQNVVITHHLPSKTLIHPKYKQPRMLPYNQWFASDLDDFILEHKKSICVWFYGHTHIPNVSRIHDVPMLCNPIGYPGENPSPEFGLSFPLAP